MIRYILVFVFVASLSILLIGKMVTDERQEECLNYKTSFFTLINYALVFYPDSEGVLNFDELPDNHQEKIIAYGQDNFSDAWGSRYLYQENLNLVYSVGKNKTDESGLGDDITLADRNKGVYCKD
ncbi:hypothetical protein [Algibacillus agarilyticus]|uniref:hypothetical protein n=1 Tax=Algibacillus agarilyticus TaxID=2234133 RepID=UPI000DD07E98|nr:hypothetical protein [Algibacillus agarilyticus]